jgi:hypothetical protein
MSNRRILLAVVLAGTVGFLGLHRFYAGRYWTGLAQLALFGVGMAWGWKDYLLINAAIHTLTTLPDMLDWSANHPIAPWPWVLILISATWAVFDCGVLLARKFRDGSGKVMTRWI